MVISFKRAAAGLGPQPPRAVSLCLSERVAVALIRAPPTTTTRPLEFPSNYLSREVRSNHQSLGVGIPQYARSLVQ